MKSKTVVSMFFFFVLAFISSSVFAQETISEQTLFSLTDKNSPFKEGETVISGITFTGLDSDTGNYSATDCPLLFESDFQGILVVNRWGTPFFPNSKFNREKVKELTKKIQEITNTAGYLEAKISIVGEKVANDEMRLVVSVERGAVARVSEIRVIGNKNLPSDQLVEDLKDCLNTVVSTTWTVFRKGKYRYCSLRHLQDFMFSKGFLQAKVKDAVPNVADGGYVVTIEVEEGIRYQIGDIKITGATAFSENEILQMMNQNVGETADNIELKIFFEEKLRRSYADKGYIFYKGAFEESYVNPKADGLDGIVNIRATISEGRSYKISKIYFSEIKENKAEELRNASGLKVNDVYSENALENALKHIDDTEEFEPTNLGFSVHLEADEDTGELEITFYLSKKE